MKNKNFIISIGGFDLPDETNKKIEAKIKTVVYEELAKLDFMGDINIKNNPEKKAVLEMLGEENGGLSGARVEPRDGA